MALCLRTWSLVTKSRSDSMVQMPWILGAVGTWSLVNLYSQGQVIWYKCLGSLALCLGNWSLLTLLWYSQGRVSPGWEMPSDYSPCNFGESPGITPFFAAALSLNICLPLSQISTPSLDVCLHSPSLGHLFMSFTDKFTHGVCRCWSCSFLLSYRPQ